MGLFTMMESGRKASDFFNVAAVYDRRIPAHQRPHSARSALHFPLSHAALSQRGDFFAGEREFGNAQFGENDWTKGLPSRVKTIQTAWLLGSTAMLWAPGEEGTLPSGVSLFPSKATTLIVPRPLAQ